MQKILFLQPIFHERIWGGTRLKDKFNYDIPSDKTGECWAISAHKNGDCIIRNGQFSSKKLSEVYKDHRDLFSNSKSPVFPLLTKILDAEDDLSVQVHPNDEYALKVENELGKTECWYILDCEENAEMIFGHNASTIDEMTSMIHNNEWDTFLTKIKIKPGDFFYVPTGTIHALCKGTLVLETQQSSDTTYRVYDYNRKDDKGNTRPLHIDKAIDVTTVPHQRFSYNFEVMKVNEAVITRFISSKFFTVEKWCINGKLDIDNNNKFLLVSVINGEGIFNDEKVKKGDHFIVTSVNQKFECHGKMDLIVSYI